MIGECGLDVCNHEILDDYKGVNHTHNQLSNWLEVTTYEQLFFGINSNDFDGYLVKNDLNDTKFTMDTTETKYVNDYAINNEKEIIYLGDKKIERTSRKSFYSNDKGKIVLSGNGNTQIV